jgi:hypothetical protein
MLMGKCRKKGENPSYEREKSCGIEKSLGLTHLGGNRGAISEVVIS